MAAAGKKPGKCKKPKLGKCPQCETILPVLAEALAGHFFLDHGRSPTPGEENQFKAPRKRAPKKRISKRALKSTDKKKASRKAKKVYVDRSIFAKKSLSSLTPEQQQARERINSRGFHEGANVAGSNVRRIDK